MRVTLAPEQLAATLAGGGFARAGQVGISAPSKGSAMVAIDLPAAASPPPLVAAIALAGDPPSVTLRRGTLLGGGDALLALPGGDRAKVTIEELGSGAKFDVPSEIAPGTDGGAGVGWWKRTSFRTPARAPGSALLRAVTEPLGAWSIVELCRPGGARAFRAVQRDTDGPASIAAAELSPDGALAVVALARRGGPAELRGIATADGAVRFRAPLPASPADWLDGESLLRFAPDGRELVIVVEDPARCETCRRAEVRRAVDGGLVRSFPLAVVGGARGRLGRESFAGFDGALLWLYRFQPARKGLIDALPDTCGYELYDTHRADAALLRTERDVRAFDGCRVRALLPDASGVLALRPVTPDTLELLSFSAPP